MISAMCKVLRQCVLYLLLLIMGCECSNNHINNPANVDGIEPSSTINQRLLSTGYSFQPKYIELEDAIYSDSSTISLFRDIPLSILRQQKEYNNFLVIILLKLYYFHILQGNQGYDLISMKKKEAAILIDDFCSLARVDSNIEMLNSAYVMSFVEQHESFLQNGYIVLILDSIKTRENEIYDHIIDKERIE